MSYGPGAVKPDFCVTRGPMSAYAPPFHHTSHSRATMRPSLSTPLLMRNVLACLVMVKNCSSIVSETFDGPFVKKRQNADQGLQLDVELGAEAAAEERHAHADAVFRPAEQARDLDAHERRTLRSRMDGERALGRLRHRDQRLERRVHHLLRAEAVLEDAVRPFHRIARVAATQMKVEGDVGVRRGP